MIDSKDIMLHKKGILIPDPKSGKENKFIPWSLTKRETLMPCLSKVTGRMRDMNFEVYYVRKSVNGNKIERLYPTERDALRAIDMLLMRNGQPPQHVFKKL